MSEEPRPPEKVGRPTALRELDRSLVKGVAWSGAAKWTAQAVTWLSTLFVARLLTPADYGVVGLAWLYLGLVAMMTEFGIASAVVTIRTLSARQLCQLNALAVILGATACGLSLVLALPLARFFDQPQLAAVVTVLSCGALLSSFKVLPEALLQKELRFRRLAIYEGAQSIIAALSTLGLATAGWGYWALVAGNLLGVLSHLALVVGTRPVSLSWPRRGEIGPAVSLSRDVLVSRLSWYTYDNADFLVAGKLLGPSLLGAYSLAWTFASMPVDRLVSLVGRVTPAVLSAVQHQPAELRRYVLRLTEAMSLALFPAGVGLALVADDFVRAILGERWLTAVGPLRFLSLYACVRGMTPIWSQVLTVTRDTRFLMGVTAAGALILPLGFVAGSHWGVTGIALAWLLLHPPVIAAPMLRRLLTRVDLRLADYAQAIRPAATATLVMAVAVVAARSILLNYGSPVRLAVGVAVGCLSYLVAISVFGGERLRGLAGAWAVLRASR